ncbi:MAG: hypothetical protein M1840_006978 [Geoglossum simile]|nr:MAG: hypothetical protein M1840_006978 [Geoglossum simile]
MSTANLVKITPPTEGFLAIVGTCENEVRQAADKQTNSADITKLDLPSVCQQVEVEYFKNHYAKMAVDYSIEEPSRYKPSIFLLNGGSYIVPAGFAVAFIPLVILDTPTAKARLPQSDPIQLQVGSMVVYVAGAGEACLEMRGGGRVVCAFFLFKVREYNSAVLEEGEDPIK